MTKESARRSEEIDHRLGKRREILRCAAGDEIAIDHDRSIHPDGTGVFQIVSDDDLRAALESDDVRPPPQRVADVTAAPIADKVKQAAAELSLVSTQALRKVLKPDGSVEYAKPKTGKKDKHGGFDPYDNN